MGKLIVLALLLALGVLLPGLLGASAAGLVCEHRGLLRQRAARQRHTLLQAAVACALPPVVFGLYALCRWWGQRDGHWMLVSAIDGWLGLVALGADAVLLWLRRTRAG